MKNPNNQIIITTIFILLLMCVYAVSGANAEHIKVEQNKILYNDVREVKNDTEQYCFVKIIIKEKDGVVSKEEELYCSDGRKGIDTPSYWELFAQFYYRDIPTPEYCRYYSRKKHAFKSFGKVCLNKDGEWKVK